MQKILMAAVVTTIGIASAASPASALLDHTWVASNGSNAAVCDRANPCADFATAIGKTNTSGEIGCIDSGQFGGLTITKAITIDCIGVQASVLVGSGANGITVTVPGGTKVVLRGLDIQGLGVGSAGIFLTQGGILHVEKCVIHDLNGSGIQVFSTNATELYVIDTSSIDNVGIGIFLQPGGGPVVNAVLDHVHLNGNGTGLRLAGNSGATTRTQITNSTISGSLLSGVAVTTGAQPTTVVVASSLLSGNDGGVFSNGSGAAVILNGNTITNNRVAMGVASGGALFFYGNNAVNDNGSPGTAPTLVGLR